MFREFVKIYVLIAITMLFAICYQSLHIFTDEAHQHRFHDEIVHKKTSETQFTQDNHEDCPVCDFEFAAFLTEDVFVVHLFSPQPKFHFSNMYESVVKEKEFLCFSHRGPPVV